MKLTPVHVVGLGAGILLVYASVRDINPLATVKAVLQGKPPPPPGSWAPADYGTKFGTVAPKGTITSVNYTGGRWPTTSRTLGPRFEASYEGDPWEAGHDGLDIDGACGDPIWSPVDGKVTSAGYAGAYGNRVVVKAFGASDLEFWLCHLGRVTVRAGSVVSQGTRVGSMGQTGNAYGCHLHLVAEVNGTKVDPLPLIGGGGGQT
ncbi:MAG: M23 family metallopeptidase [Candidatus Binatia bacterium]